jgi:hypothetical protein
MKSTLNTRLLITIIGLCAIWSTHAATTFTYRGIKYTTLTDNTCQTAAGVKSGNSHTAGNDIIGDVVIPEVVYDSSGKAYTVTEIGNYGFFYAKEMTSIAIPKTVTTIGAWAFQWCTGLERVNITNMAAWCSLQYAYEAPLTYYINPLKFAHHLFLNGQEVTELTIPSSITYVNDYSFDGCTGLTSVTFPESVTSIGPTAFRNCTGLTSVTFPESVTYIGIGAFSGCDGLKWI